VVQGSEVVSDVVQDSEVVTGGFRCGPVVRSTHRCGLVGRGGHRCDLLDHHLRIGDGKKVTGAWGESLTLRTRCSLSVLSFLGSKVAARLIALNKERYKMEAGKPSFLYHFLFTCGPKEGISAF
jgi:hypothetical protein